MSKNDPASEGAATTVAQPVAPATPGATTVAVLGGKKMVAKRATEDEVRARAARLNRGIMPAQPSAAEMDTIYADAGSSNADKQRAAMLRFHQAMRTLGSAEARKAAGDRMAGIMANRAGSPARERSLP